MQNEETETQGVTPSMFQDILSVVGNKEEAEKIIANLNKDPHQETKKRVKEMFPLLSKEQSNQILQKYKYNLNLAIDDLQLANSKIEEKLMNERLEQEKIERQKKQKAALEQVMKKYSEFSKEQILQIFKECDNNVQKTVQKILSLISEKKKKRDQQIGREASIKRIIQLYNGVVEEEKVRQILEEEEFNIDNAILKLDEIKFEKAVTTLCLSFQGQISREYAYKVLQENYWNQAAAYKVCEEALKQKKSVKVVKKEVEEAKKEAAKQSFIVANQLKKEAKEDIGEGSDIITNEITSAIFEVIEPESDEKDSKQQGDKEEKPTLTVNKVNDKIVAEWKYKAPSRSAWIGLYLSSEQNTKKYITYNYLCYTKNNTIEFDAPKLNEKYNVRIFSNRYNKVFTSEDIVIDVKDQLFFTLEAEENKVTVRWQIGSFDPVAKKAYVTVHKSEEDRYRYYRRYNWVNGFSGEHRFKKLVHAGEYEARLYIGSKLILKSKSIAIPGI